MELQIKDKTNESEELKKQNRALQEQLLELNKTLRQMQRSFDEKELENAKKIAQEEQKIREEAKLKAEEEHKLKEAEKDKKISDLMKDLEETQRRLQQGSQQTQGEVQELILEEFLKKEFPNDEIVPVAKGVRGGDVLQSVFDKTGRQCGRILW
ncbi:DUF2130 domain-containing protein, partial [Candidatus Microgenomates bacterium]|nr:DUF2130 domain-containing protein [Candidatus Microgenomates bacterium]